MYRIRKPRGRDRASGIGLPLLGSAAGHIALLMGLLLPGVATGLHGKGTIEILLVEGPASSPSVPPAVGNDRRTEDTGAPERSSPGPTSLARAEVSPPYRSDPAAEPRQSPRPSPDERTPLEAGIRSAVRGPPGTGKAPPGEGDSGPAVLPESPPRPARAGPRGDAGPREAPIPKGGGHGLAAAGDAAGGGGDPGRLALLRHRIQEKILYPPEAVRRGAEGEVLLRIRIGNGGIPREIRVARSSGARILDEAARRGVVRAAPLPSDPGWFEIPVRFSLR